MEISKLLGANFHNRELKYKLLLNLVNSNDLFKNTASNPQSQASELQIFVNLLWKYLADTEVSWLGIYGISSHGDKQLELLAREDKPACSPIALHGVCGKALTSKKIQIVEDVYSLGDNHIVCDPTNLSEIVIPLLDRHGVCWGVLDLDSKKKSSFSANDGFWLLQILKKAELTYLKNVEL